MKKDNKLKKIISIDLPLYESTLWVSYEYTNTELIEMVKKNENFIEGDKNKKGFISYLKEDRKEYKGIFISNNHEHLIRIWKQNDMKDLINTVTHEVFHFVKRILKTKGFKLTNSSEEAYAYLTGYINGEIYDKMIKDMPEYQK